MSDWKRSRSFTGENKILNIMKTFERVIRDEAWFSGMIIGIFVGMLFMLLFFIL